MRTSFVIGFHVRSNVVDQVFAALPAGYLLAQHGAGFMARRRAPAALAVGASLLTALLALAGVLLQGEDPELGSGQIVLVQPTLMRWRSGQLVLLAATTMPLLFGAGASVGAVDAAVPAVLAHVNAASDVNADVPMILGFVVGPVLGATAFDAFGNLTGAFVAAAVVALCAALLALRVLAVVPA